MADETLNALVTEAMFRALDEKKREELIKGALATLITPKQGPYGSRVSSTPIQDAFDYAIHSMAREMVITMIKTPEAQEAISKVVTAAFHKMVEDTDRLAAAMATAMVDAFTKARD